MAILSAAELNQQAGLSYVRGTYYVALLNSANNYDSTINYAGVVADEVPAGTGGYARLSYTYINGDLLAYANGQPLSDKIANFVHNGSAQNITFTHVALLRLVSSTYTVVGVQSVGETVVLNNGNTAAITIRFLHGRP